MGEGTPHVTGASARVGALGAEATAARERLDVLVAELRRRRDELMDWRTQLRRHRRGLTIVLGGVVALAAAALAVPIARTQKKGKLTTIELDTKDLPPMVASKLRLRKTGASGIFELAANDAVSELVATPVAAARLDVVVRVCKKAKVAELDFTKK